MGNLCHLGLIRAHQSFIDPMASFEEIMRHMPQLDTQDRERDNPHRTGPENPSPDRSPALYTQKVRLRIDHSF